MKSFSSSVKEYLTQRSLLELGIGEAGRAKWKECCAKSFLRFVFLFSAKEEGERVLISSKCPDFLEAVEFCLIRAMGLEAKPLAGKANKRTDRLSLPKDAKREVLEQTAMPNTSECEKCDVLKIRAAFLSGGTVLDPNKGYHAAFSAPGEQQAEELLSVLRKFGIEGKKSPGKKGFLVYLKESGKIEDLLAVMGAQKFSLELMNGRIDKMVRGDINRRQNFEGANMKKAVDGAQSVIASIRYLMDRGRLETLPESLQKAAKLRLAYPEVSLSELAEHSEDEITKSGLNHRLQRLVLLAREQKKKDEEV